MFFIYFPMAPVSQEFFHKLWPFRVSWNIFADKAPNPSCITLRPYIYPMPSQAYELLQQDREFSIKVLNWWKPTNPQDPCI